jgi:TIR domain
MKVFVSYSHAQGDWVWDRLVPCLKAGGAEVLIDRDRFRIGGGVYRQMDATQDQADRHVLVLSADYLASAPCQHEMQRAIDRDPTFAAHIVLPVRRDDVTVPDALKGLDPNLYADLRDDSRADQWRLLLKECGVSLGASAPDWLVARDEVARLLESSRSVNLVVHGDVRWRDLIDELRARPALKLAAVDLENPVAVPRDRFIAALLAELGAARPVPAAPYDLPVLGQALQALGLSRVVLQHFDMVLHRPDYNVDLFAALRYLVMDARQLVLLVQSRAPVASLLPQGHPLSHIDFATVELRAGP